MVTSVLVANRGEIACRVFRTCRELGVATVAVYSDADAGTLHVREADAAVRLPGTAPRDTYLRGEAVVAAALAAGADAVHPGYGFLSENAAFARRVRAAGLVWIGPPPEAIEAMASKTRAKALMAAAGVPLLAAVDPAAAGAADMPLILKAAAGGGGRGMRIVREPRLLAAELASARAEAEAAFGDGEVFAEPFLEGARHVEVQLLADTHGTVWELGTRDCSLQRRHQKVIEEAPAPGLAEDVRKTLCRAATDAARAIGYVGAGTVEFLVPADGRRPCFLEMNTRLQVEHPVTERVYGVDLVALQIRLAEGAPLPPGPPPARGHAVEARLYAEDPARDFAPQTGVVRALGFPGEGSTLRVDTGYAAGDTVSPHYDALLAKVVAWAPSRAEAVRKLAHALENARVHGPVTNRDLLVRTLRHPEFTDARTDTGFYARHLPELTVPREGERLAALVAALADASRHPGAWRNVPSQPQSKRYRTEPGGTEHEVRYRCTRQGLVPEGFPGVRVLSAAPDRVVLETGGVRRTHPVAVYGTRVHVGPHALTALPRFPDATARDTDPGSLLAPMPGTVVRLAEGVAVGAVVTAGAPLLWLEAMKMEHRVVAPASGTLTALHAAPGRQVETGELLAVVTETEEESA
ncbi:acety-l/propionyl-CoA carboxylase subunit alpha [Streptomyces cinnamoneus]|uniref:Acety-l/propionyl-CoA carboxylase subunit alpha n=1 Tax=Streptomyces cinnamoneus TaxID=53446 RepID=A0A2G1XC65_STRCJ|nr:biotin carboxylase N-terminal domain-containing protein [Streptomyces cinnamoneus]PHQ48822.1 acety-l/propionyl-CoA carboxylase subunit alpha [Streptomyces cinnamoneus]PPT14532.1 acety-l/propionyl-CoA carboxylase subunit alpha [Streptomyces cinnamoneus]